MKNLKKTLAVVLAFAMVFSMGIINTFAFSDVEAGTVVDEAVGILSNLSILEGFEDGTFKPEETVTRAQMAAIICRTLGYESQAQSSKGTTAFTDVAADSWASGYINVAQAQGIINGYGNGMFGPNDKVTYEQAVKMIVAALGYDVAAAAKGGYPTGYLAIASAEGITKNANGRVGDAAARATVAVLVYNALEVRLMDQNSWSTDGSDRYAKTDDTILSKYLEVNKWEGTLTADAFTNYAKNGYEEDAVERIALSDAAYKVYTNGALKEFKKTESGNDASDVNASLVDTTGLLGKRVIAYIGDFNDAETGEPMVYAISEKSRSNESVTINALQLNTTHKKADDANAVIYYTEPGSTKVKELELANTVDDDDKMTIDADIYVNYAVCKETVNDTATLAALVENGGVIEFVSNNTDDEFEYVNIKAYTYEDVVKEVTEDEGVFEYELYNAGDLDEIDTTDEDELHIVYKDGVEAEVKDIAADNTVSWFQIGSNVFVYYVSSKTVTGVIDSADNETKVLYINDEEYSFADKSKNPETYVGEEGTFFLNVDGKIAHNESNATKEGTYGILLAVTQGKGFDANIYKARVALADGTVADYEIDEKAKYGTAKTAKDVVAKLAPAASTAGETDATTYAEAKDSLYKFVIKNGKITAISALDKNLTDKKAYEAGSGIYNADENSYGFHDFAEDAIVFSFNHAEVAEVDDPNKEDDSKLPAEIEASKISVGTVSAFFADEETGKKFYAYDQDEDGFMEIILGFQLVPGVPEDGAVVVITGRKKVQYNDEDALKITGIQAGKEVTYILYEGDGEFVKNDDNAESDLNDVFKLGVGDVILVSAASAEGIVSNYRLIYSEDTKAVTQYAVSDKEGLYTTYTTLTEVDGERFKLADAVAKTVIVEEKEVTKTRFAADTAIRIAANANYTVVDYTESDSNPTIESKGAKTALKTSKNYTANVLIRVYDDKIVDVVVYRR